MNFLKHFTLKHSFPQLSLEPYLAVNNMLFFIFIAGDEESVLNEKLHACEEGTEELLESVKEVQGKFADSTVRLTIDSN